jgi:hypothetical protein
VSNELTKAAAAQVPDHIRNRFGGGLTNSDLSGGITGGFPVISYKGKVWALVKNGEKQLMLNADGEPRSSIEVVIVKAAPTISKSFYAKGFEEGTTEAPDCHSFDGIAPAADAPKPQAKACATCPRNVWGSKITESGKKGRECADVKRLAVADPEDLDEAILLRVPAASLKFLGQFADMLSKRGAPYQAVRTRIGFDPQVAHPQFTFKAPGWLTEEQLDKVEELMNSDTVNRILGLDAASQRHAEVVAPPEEDDELGPAPAHISGKATAAQPVAKATAAPKAAAAAKAKPQVIPTEDEVEQAIVGDEVVDLAAARQAKAAPKPAAPKAQSVDAVIADADEKLADILSSLDDDD